jgi:hypothetical protein
MYLHIKPVFSVLLNSTIYIFLHNQLLNGRFDIIVSKPTNPNLGSCASLPGAMNLYKHRDHPSIQL